VESATKYWEGVSDVNVIQEGASGEGAAKERLTAERLDRIAKFFATPEEVRATWNGPKDIMQLASDVGANVLNIPKWQQHPAMVERTRQYLLAAATYAMPSILYGQMILGSPYIEKTDDGGFIVIPGDTKAANFVATIAKMIRAGVSIQNQNMNLSENAGPPTMSDDELRKTMFRLLEEDDEEGE
jgi:hypothetical protein